MKSAFSILITKLRPSFFSCCAFTKAGGLKEGRRAGGQQRCLTERSLYLHVSATSNAEKVDRASASHTKRKGGDFKSASSVIINIQRPHEPSLHNHEVMGA